jgi:hypothetical protein
METAVLSKVLDKSITKLNMNHYNRLSNKIMPAQINRFNM